MAQRIAVRNLSIDQKLHDMVRDEVLPGTGVDNTAFWESLDELVEHFGPRNQAMLDRRAELQQTLNEWMKANPEAAADPASHQAYLKEIGYLVDEGGDFNVDVTHVDSEIATVAGPQLVVPVNNARYAINAANARWGSLYDALYGTDAISEAEGAERGGAYNQVRGARVVAWAGSFLDQAGTTCQRKSCGCNPIPDQGSEALGNACQWQ